MTVVNVGQAVAWGGAQGAFWARWADRFDRGVAAHHAELVAAAGIGATDSVLDVGCGTGQLSRDAARQASRGAVLGVDLSSEQLAVARTAAARARLVNASFVRADAQVHLFEPGSVDVVLSRHGVMFFDDSGAAFVNLARALRPGGRLVALTWQPAGRNEWMSAFRTSLTGRSREEPTPTSPGPESLSDPVQVRDLLIGAGFTDVALSGGRHPMWFGADVDDALEFLSGQFQGGLAQMAGPARSAALACLRATLADHATAGGVRYDSATWLITARRA